MKSSRTASSQKNAKQRAAGPCRMIAELLRWLTTELEKVGTYCCTVLYKKRKVKPEA
jgi:hypothetical protein